MSVKLPKRYAGRFAVELRPSGRSGWIDDKQKGTAQSFICYQDGTVAFDSPGALPKPVKSSMRTYCRTRSR